LICVRDHGIGIAAEHHAVVFEKFRQVEGGGTRSYGGTGLGLAISKGLVELHGGRIWVDSKVGEGAAFYVELPRAMGDVDNVVSHAALERKSA
jgi:signal transduction histidine kinase